MIKNSLQSEGKPCGFLRSAFINGQKMHLPPLINRKIEESLIKLEKPEGVIATKEYMKNMELLKKMLVMMFDLHDHLQQKKTELENLKFDELGKTTSDSNMKKLKEN